MKLIIFEGLDNLGKSTLINKMATDYRGDYDIIIMHSKNPHCPDGEDPFKYQSELFMGKAIKIWNICNMEFIQRDGMQENMVLLDRSWIDEYVYGQIYRGEDPEKIKTLIYNAFWIFTDNKGKQNIDISIINLTASPEFIIAHDDNKSFTSGMEGDKRLEGIKKEQQLFKDILSYIDAQFPDVNVFDVNVERIPAIEGKHDFPSLKFRELNKIYAEIISDLNIIL